MSLGHVRVRPLVLGGAFILMREVPLQYMSSSTIPCSRALLSSAPPKPTPLSPDRHHPFSLIHPPLCLVDSLLPISPPLPLGRPFATLQRIQNSGISHLTKMRVREYSEIAFSTCQGFGF